MSPSRLISLGVAFRTRDPRGLANYAAAVSTPSSPDFHHYLTPAEFDRRYGPLPSTVGALRSLLREDGLAVGKPSTNGLIVPVSGTTSEVEAAFHTSLTGYRLADGKPAWASSSAYLPATLASSVAAVVGINDLATPHSMLERAPSPSQRALKDARSAPVAGLPKTPGVSDAASVPKAPAGSPVACAAATDAALDSGGWTDQQLAQAYGLEGLYKQGDLGQGQTIAVFELEPFAPSDLRTFDRCYFGVSHLNRVSTVRLDGFNFVGTGSGEALLDLEDLSALAPDANIVVYDAPNTTFGAIDAYNAIVSQDRAAEISTSWGECETALQTAAPEVQQIENTIFEEAAAQGQTTFAAAGDSGSDDCASSPFFPPAPAAPYLSVDDPASQPFVVGVGGTSMSTDTDPPIQSVWNDGAKWGAGGGGVSNTWAAPSWQAASGVPGVNPAAKREVPDVSAAADEWRGITVFSALFGQPAGSSRAANGNSNAPPAPPAGWTTLGGTSSAAPIWAAITAEIAASNKCSSLGTAPAGRTLGFVAPMLYEIAGSTSYASSLSNVTRGSNDVFGLGLGYRAHAGYNLASGLGTPIVTNAAGGGGLDASLCALAITASSSGPTVASLSPASGTVSGGTTVTITGTGFPAGDPAAVKVQFGTASATVTAVPSSTSIVVTAPAAVLPLDAASLSGSGAAGPAMVTVTVTSGSTIRSSRPSAGSIYQYEANSGTTVGSPVVTGVSPSGGNVAGGEQLTIYGQGFTATGAGTPTVTVGGVPATDVSVVSSTQLKAKAPAEGPATSCATGSGFDPADACQVQVVVSDANGTSPTAQILPAMSGPIVFNADSVVVPTAGTEVSPSPTEFDYAPTPVIRSIVPNPGDATGTTPVTIVGSGFNFLTFEWVNFGPPTSVASQQTQILYISPTEVQIAPPATSLSGTGEQPLKGGVSVQSVGGLSNVEPFFYGGIARLSKLSVLGGPSTGGTTLRLSGVGLASTKVIEFLSEIDPAGYGAAVSVVISDRTDTSLTVRTPADLPGPVDVLACSASGCSRPDPSVDTFVFYSTTQPRISTINPRSGPAKGGTEVTFYGNGLNGVRAVHFGNHLSKLLLLLPDYPDGDPYVAGAIAPPGNAGSVVPITVSTVAGSSAATPVAAFHYLPSAPSAPTALHVAMSGTTAHVTWAPPLSDGGSPITHYVVSASAPGSAITAGRFPASSRSASVTRLLSGRSYTFRVVAENATHGRGPSATASNVESRYVSNGYRVVTTSGVVEGFGSLSSLGGIGGESLAAPVVDIVGTHDSAGYWLLQRDGTVSAFGDAAALGSIKSAQTFVAMTPTSTGTGYWLVTSTGQVFAFGSAKNFGSLPPAKLHGAGRIVGIAASPGDKGYWLATSTGQVFTFGKATHEGAFSGSLGAASVVAIAANAGGDGYWLVTSAGQVFGFGAAGAYGAPKPAQLHGANVVSVASSADGLGYWIVAANGSVFSFGDARFEGRAYPATGSSVAAISAA